MSHPSAERWTPLGTGVALLTALLVTGGCGGTSDPARTQAARTRGPARPTATASGTFVSKALPYQLVLPEGWSVDPISQGASSGGDEFVNAAGSGRLVVGPGCPGAGETLADRVRVNRSDEVGHGCSSEPKQDRPIRVSGQRGTLW